MTTEKKQFRVVGIHRPGKTIGEYAQELEDKMNELTGTGYDVGLRDDRDGVILIGDAIDDKDDDRATPTAPSVPRTIAELLSRFGMQPPPEHTQRTGDLLRKFVDVTNLRACDVAKVDNVRVCVAGYSAKELAEAAETFEKAAEQHNGHDDCDIGEFLKAVAQAVKQATHENLQ